MFKTEGLIETHFHGAFGVDFMDCTSDDVIYLAEEIAKLGVTRIYPTLMTGDIAQIQKQIKVIKEARDKQPENTALISGIHLEGPFINPEKKGIHQVEYMLEPTIENYQKIEDEFIKIVTLAPELDRNNGLMCYLMFKGVKVQAGHTMSDTAKGCSGVTHFFNALPPLTHKKNNIISSALTNDDIYIELIADGNHVVDEVIKMVIQSKSNDKIILISDALPITREGFDKCIFAGQEVELKNGSFYNSENTLAGSGMLTCDILKRLVKENILSFDEAVYMMNITPAKYMNILNNGYVTFDEDINPIKTEFI